MVISRAACICLAFLAGASPAGAETAACETMQRVLAFNGKTEQEIAFRYQDCHNGMSLMFDAANKLTATWANDPEFYPASVQFFALGGKAPAARIREIAEPLIAPEDQGRCEVRTGSDEHTYSYTPDARYTDELDANGLWQACGPYGDFNETSPYWMVIDGLLIAYFSTGLEPPPFDPASFTYRNSRTPGLAE